MNCKILLFSVMGIFTNVDTQPHPLGVLEIEKNVIGGLKSTFHLKRSV